MRDELRATTVRRLGGSSVVLTRRSTESRARARCTAKRRRARLIAALSVSQVIAWGVLYYSFGVFVLPMQAELGWSSTEIAAGMSIAWGTSAMTAVPMGRWIDRIGGRRVIVRGSICGALLIVAWSRVEGLTSFYAIWAAIGVVMAMTFYESAFAELVRSGLRRSIGLVALVGATAGFVFAPLSSLLIEGLGWRTALVVLATGLAASAALHPILVADDGRAPPGAVDTGRTYPSDGRSDSGTIGLFTAGAAIASAASVAVGVHAVPLLVEAGHDPLFAASLLGMMSLSLIPGRAVYALLERLVRRPQLMIGGFVVSGAAMVLLVHSESTGWAVVSAVSFGAANSVKTPALAAILAEWCDVSEYATVGGIVSTFVRGAQAVAPALAGFARTTAGDYDVVSVGLGVAFGVSAVTVAVGARRIGRGRPRSPAAR